MPTLYLEWGSDFVVTNTGSLQIATGWDEIRQRIERRLLTNPSFTLPDGTPVSADYFFHTDYGEGLPLYVGQSISEQWMNQVRKATLAAVGVDSGVVPGSIPNVQFVQTDTHEVYMSISIQLLSGQTGKIALQIQ